MGLPISRPDNKVRCEESSAVSVSVVIPSLNEECNVGRAVERCAQGLPAETRKLQHYSVHYTAVHIQSVISYCSAQRGAYLRDVIVVDGGSNDLTVSRARAAGAEVFSV